MEAVYFGNANGGLNHGGAGNKGATPAANPSPNPSPNSNPNPNRALTLTNPNSTPPDQARGRGSWQTWRTRCGALTR